MNGSAPAAQGQPRRIFVLVAKWIGLRCLEHLLDRFPEDSYDIVVSEPEAALIGETLANRGIRFHWYGAEAVAALRARPVGHYDWILNLWGAHIYRTEDLVRARHSLNIHPSLLPYCRGRDPVVWALRNGWPAGVTLHEITEGVDEGPIWYQEEVPYRLPETGGAVYDRIAERCWQVFAEQWSSIRLEQIRPQPQGQALRTFRRKDLLGDRTIDFDGSAADRDVILRLLAHDFGPGYKARLRIGGELYDATLTLTPSSDAQG